jgi:hypothetical protein
LGCEDFRPNIKERRSGQSFGNPYVINHYFRATFANFFASRLLHQISFTRGVSKVVKFGGEPTAIDDSIIELIQSRAAEEA